MLRVKLNNLPSPEQSSSKIYSASVKVNHICITAYKGKYYAFQAHCPHAGAKMNKGWCDNSGNIVCPLHNIRFNLETGASDNNESRGLRVYPVIEENGEWYLLMS